MIDKVKQSIMTAILENPSKHVVVIEFIGDSSPEIVHLEDGEGFSDNPYYFSETYCDILGSTPLFDSIVRVFFNEYRDEDRFPIFTLDFEFMNEIDRDFTKFKTIINEHSLSEQKIGYRVRAISRQVSSLEGTLMNVVFCDRASARVTRTNTYEVIEDKDNILKLKNGREIIEFYMGGRYDR